MATLREPRMWDGGLFFGDGVAVYAGPAGPAGWHAHHAVQVATARDAPLTVELEDGTARCGATVVVPSGVRHRLETRARHVVVVFVDGAGTVGRTLDARARAGDALPELLAREPAASAADTARVVTAAIDAMPGPAVPQAAPAPRSPHVAGAWPTAAQAAPAPRSPHVAGALAWVEDALGPRPARLRDAAAALHVSPSHLTHVFTRDVGLPFQRYVLWRRLRRVVEQVAEGATLTAAAAGAGFSDSAHLSRTFRRTFGLPPSALLRMQLLCG